MTLDNPIVDMSYSKALEPSQKQHTQTQIYFSPDDRNNTWNLARKNKIFFLYVIIMIILAHHFTEMTFFDWQAAILLCNIYIYIYIYIYIMQLAEKIKIVQEKRKKNENNKSIKGPEKGCPSSRPIPRWTYMDLS